MAGNHPKNLENDFNNLSINPLWKTGAPPSKHTLNAYRLNKKDYSFKNILVTQNCNCKISKKSKNKSHLIQPAKLNLPISVRKSSKSFLLRPPTLTVASDKPTDSTEDSSVVLVSNNVTPVSPSEQKFNESKMDSRISKSVANEDTDILKAFDTLTFRELKAQSKTSSSENPTSVKRENNSSSSCSVQARMEPSLPGDCDDTSIEELASYFDLFVHIPKKMSSMAEMMYI